jgi:lipopolysaccharide export LptBFGC system permease protein LptF
MPMEAFVERAFVIFNVCEGVLWVAIAAGFAEVYRRRRENGDLMLASGLLFLVFGISDFVEIHTGGWYKPWWMLLWKGSTLVGFVVAYLLFRRRRQRSVAAAD